MDKSRTENKLDRAGETKTVIDAVTCPERTEHRGRIGSMCRGCGEMIPSLPAYTPAQMSRYFPGAGIVETPSHAFPYTEEEAQVMKRYETVRDKWIESCFAVEEARAAVNGTVQRRDRSGNTEDIEETRQRAYQLRGGVAGAEQHRELLRAEAESLLLQHTKLGEIRTNKITQAMWNETYTPEYLAQMARDRAVQPADASENARRHDHHG